MIELHPSVHTLDSSKISDYMRCPRRFFYRHILGWQSEYPNINLVHGQAWHLAKEHIFINGTSRESLAVALEKYTHYYRQFYGEAVDFDNAPKDPANAGIALIEYARQFGDPRDEWAVAMIDSKPATEIYGTVPISDTKRLHFKIDAITYNKTSGLFRIWDHKSSGSDNPVYQAAWHMSFQMSTYYHAANCLYTPKNVKDICVDLSIFRKKGNAHTRLPIVKSVEVMNSWLFDANRWYELIEMDLESLGKCSEDSSVLAAFQKNDSGCIKYNKKCSYFDFCMAWANPLRRCQEVPAGLKVDFWSPADNEKKAKQFVEVGKS